MTTKIFPLITNDRWIGRELRYGYLDDRGLFMPVSGPFRVKDK